MATIAVLGLGRMGQGIAARLLYCGHKVTVWNRTPAKAAHVIQKGAIRADTPSEACCESTIVFSMVADDRASTNVWTGPKGAMESLQPGSFAIECSTLSAGHVAQLSGIAAEKGLYYIDCPVTGLPNAAADGKLTLLVGAAPATLKEVKPVLDCIADTIRYFGPVGTGTAYKLMINLMGAVQIAALAEGMALADKLGLDKETVIKAIESSAAASPQVVRHVRSMAELNFADNPSFTTSLRYKDAAYALALAASAGSPALLGQVAANWFKAASAAGEDKDEGTVINAVYAYLNCE